MSSIFQSIALAALLLLPVVPTRAVAQAVVPPSDSVEPAAAPGVLRAAAARIRPGDRVVVHVWREPELSDADAVVNERSEVVLPRLGLVPVAQHTSVTLREWLRGQYASFLRDPVVDVTVLRRVVVNGEVNKPGIFHVDINTSLRDVIAQAGGIGPAGTWRNVAIVRGDRRVPVRDWTEEGSAIADLRSGDQVIVGRKSWLAQNALNIAGTLAAFTSVVISLASLRR